MPDLDDSRSVYKVIEEYSDRIFWKIENDVPLEKSEKYILDLAAESVGLPISKMYETTKKQLVQYMKSTDFLAVKLGSYVRRAQEIFDEQDKDEPALGEANEHIRALNRITLAIIRGSDQDKILSNADIIIALYEIHIGTCWGETTCFYNGRETPVFGRKESRELDEYVASLDLTFPVKR